MTGFKRAAWFVYQLFAAYTIFIYILIFWTPFHFWITGFMMMSFPVVILLHIAAVLFWVLLDRRKIWLPILLLLVATVFLPRTYQSGNKPEPASDAFSVLSYNVVAFQRDATHHDKPMRSYIRQMQRWVRDAGADVICMPEYYEDVTKLYQINRVLHDGGYRHSRFYNNRQRSDPSYWGLAVYSRYPIIASKDTVFISQNGMIQVDVKIRKDTVRVIGLHFFSMTLNMALLKQQRTGEGFKREGTKILRRMKRGFDRHAVELHALETWIASSPYPVIVCGDFNETAYSYVYGRLRRKLSNAFEVKGKGFGFTYNHTPNFIRIDHQFYSDDRLELTNFMTFDTVQYSDHYPIMGTYRLR
ncbi:endonuclease/exonuclease/phosphatase family protein [Dyadobacter sandarakinus]|uniref:Endonuclease/exonuclease/phosphatase family protein n=1 Tax=Dyadobacter sandarakinus TaxID=2747268 RepID=A0ABX7I325_9BACT|nr:endonuclease/exonuclease/phosphatase family protein [Dyadobacter sandarakinus]QRQ99435.1 endonuclease/exonuclease/phosphatase family protein [Dyadobacter sandarakinus]